MAEFSSGVYRSPGDDMNPSGVLWEAKKRVETNWAEANQSCLIHEFARLRSRIGTPDAEPNPEVLQHLRVSMQAPPAIDMLASIFGLSAFERDLVLLCAGIEMDSALAARCGEALGRPQRSYITFALALSALGDPHWSALSPLAPLRKYRLIEMEAGFGLTAAPLRLHERVLHFLAGVNGLDTSLELLLQSKPYPVWAADGHRELATTIAARVGGDGAEGPLVHLSGDDSRGQEDIAALLAEHMGRELFILPRRNIPAPGTETDHFIQLWSREAMLLPGLLLLQLEAPGLASAARQVSPAADDLMERLPGSLLVASRDPLPESLDRYRESYEVNRPGPAAQKRLWQRALGPAAANLEAHLDDIAEQFRLSAETVFSVARSAAGRIQLQVPMGEPEAAKNPPHAEQLWNACRAISRPRLDDLAARIASGSRPAQWNDLVLPELQKQILRQMAAQLRHRLQVYETWGFSERGRRGLGLSALFCGHSGTGKTWAAEVLAAELKLDLYRIDLSAVVSKYIGETEKNLKQVFDAAECGGVLLLFDEADALFGKRAEVKDGRDRYANMEVGYLLQRMENFGGLAILTTNLKASLDRAFQRRLRFIVDFPFPDAAQREAIWGRIFPKDAPTKGLDMKRLAQLNMTGGNIRNIALNAAFLAADAGTPVEMGHLLQATRLEAMKAERPLAESEIRGWV
jgi:ATPase family associated with various cellular activities (AAA)